MAYITKYTVALVKEDRISYPIDMQVKSSALAATVLWEQLRRYDREHFVVLMLNTKLKIIGWNTVSIGSKDKTIALPPEVFTPAMLASAYQIICGHNHPSGDCMPSADDLATTRRLVRCGELLGVPVIDHIIIGGGTDTLTYWSMADNGQLSA